MRGRCRRNHRAGDCGSELPLLRFCGKSELLMFIKFRVKLPQRLIITLDCFEGDVALAASGKKVFTPKPLAKRLKTYLVKTPSNTSGSKYIPIVKL